MRALRQMQVQNQSLRQKLGLSEDSVVPEAEEAEKLHIGRLEVAIQSNFDLQLKLLSADKELAQLNVTIANLPREERLTLTSGSVSPPPSSITAEDSAEVKRQTDKVMTEIQEVTRVNIDLIRDQDEILKLKEKDLSNARRQQQQMVAQANSRTTFSDKHSMQEQLQSCQTQLQDLQNNVQEIEDTLKQRLQKKDSEYRTNQALETERDVLTEEIESIKQSLQRVPREEEPEMLMPPATAVLSLEADQMETQLTDVVTRGQQEQGALELQVEELRRLTKEYKEQLQTVLADKELAQLELQELKETRDGAKALDRECQQLREYREALAGDTGRCRSMIKVYDEKISELQNETADIRRRVEVVAGNR